MYAQEQPQISFCILPLSEPKSHMLRVPESVPQSGGGGGEGKTITIPVGATPKDTLNRYVNAVIQKALF